MTPVRILLIAHAPLAHALRDAALHVFRECAGQVVALDVQADASPEDSLLQAQALVSEDLSAPLLVMTDVFGATPSNVAMKLAEGRNARVISGANVPMLLRAWCYRAEPLDALANRAQAGGTQGIVLTGGGSAPQNQVSRSHHDPEHRDHQQ